MLITETPYSPQVSWRTENYNIDNATIILEWSKETGVTYRVNVIPSPLENINGGNTSQLIVLYNTSYSVDVLATFCENNTNKTVIDIIVNQFGELLQ